MNTLSVLVLCASLVAATVPRTAYVCNVQITGFTMENPMLTVNNRQYSFADDFNSISFGNFYAPSGDVEARSAVQNNVDISQYSFGYQIRSGGVSAYEKHREFSLVAGGSVSWNGGALYPQGTGFPYAGEKERGYASSFSGSDYLVPEFTIGSRLDDDFVNAKNYYVALSNAFAGVAPTASYSITSWGTATVTCPSSSGLNYSINVSPSQLSSTSYWQIDNCNADATLLINVLGAGSVTFSGNQEISGLKASNVLYNIPGDEYTSVNIQVGVTGSILAPRATYVQRGQGVVIGLVIVGDMAQVHQINRVECAPPTQQVPQPTPTCLGFESNCAGLSFPLGADTYNFRDFNAISFGNFISQSGDTEGRVAVRGSASMKTYSVGDKIQDRNGGRDVTRAFSLIVGGDLSYSGGIYPIGDASYDGRPAYKENIFVGGSLDATADIQERRTGSCSTPGCLNSAFDAAKSCYERFSSEINTYVDNATLTVRDSGAFIYCNDNNASSYAVTIDSSVMDTFTYWHTDNCNTGAYWFINIRGTKDVNFHGDSFPAIPGGVVYNVIGSRVVNVDGTAVAGHILAPNAILNQTGGVILGKVVAADVIASLQINRENTCPQTVVYQTPVVVADSTDSASNSFGSSYTSKRSSYRMRSMSVVGGCENVPAGSVISNSQGQIVVDSATAGSMTRGARTCVIEGSASYAITAQPAGSVLGKISRSSTAANVAPASDNMDSSATVVGISVVAILASILAL